MEDIIEVLSKLEDFAFVKGVSENDIAKAEENLGVQFAPDYKQYLAEYGLASADGQELTGIVKSPRLNVVDVTIKLRKKFKNVPVDAYVLEKVGIDKLVIFQTSDGSVYKATPESQFIKVADSLSEYLEKLLYVED